MPASKEVYSFPTTEDISKALNHLITTLSAAAISRSGRFTVALSGGSLPKILGQSLKGNTSIDFSKWHVFFADERVVPLNHEDSNYRLCKEFLFDHVSIPQHQIYPIKEGVGHVRAAELYEEELRRVFGKEGVPSFDLILLGMGPDGHTCSLFPGHRLLEVTDRLVASLDDSPKPPPERITFTYPVLNNADVDVFVSTGEGKAEVVHKILDLKEDYPAGRVSPKNRLVWFLDEPAAGKLQTRPMQYRL
ncbi:6-phosphogluconolactonase [Borealophlyctis nickersoniae]|nr:6-phosphogluconolactonase [Borealophlyctis nickersoniae]